VSVLALDCSRRGRLVCIVASESGELVSGGVDLAVGSAGGLIGRLATLLDATVTATVVVNGPGSYTGLRAALAAALGLRAARGLAVHTVGALELAAHRGPAGGRVRVVADAGRGGLYTAVYVRAGDGVEEVEPPRRLAAGTPIDTDLPLLSLDPLELAGLVRVDPALALAAAVPTALARPALDHRPPPVVYLSAIGAVAAARV